jgi:choline dehydrogenase
LESLGITVIQDLAVGYNLMDHIALGGLIFTVNRSVSLKKTSIFNDPRAISNYFAYHDGPLAIPGGCEALAFYDLKDPTNPHGYPSIELLFQGGSIVSEHSLRRVFGIKSDLYNAVYKPIENNDTWMVLPMLMRPRSKGRIMLKDKNPFHKPLIKPNYFQYDEDLETMVAGVKKTIELSKTKGFQKFGSKLHDIPIPACSKHVFGSDDYWRCAIRHLTFTIYHLSGTCKMGPKWDSSAVVDPRLRVYGIKGLRVVDVSVIPEIPVGHTNGPTFMIAEKGADLIKEDWGVPLSK